MKTIDLKIAFVAGIRGIGGIPGNGITAGRTNPGNRAHAFRITVVDKQTPSNYILYMYMTEGI